MIVFYDPVTPTAKPRVVQCGLNTERAYKSSLKCSACQSNIAEEGEWTYLIGSLATVLF